MVKKLIVSFAILSLINIALFAQDIPSLKKIALLPADVRVTGNIGQLTTEQIYQAEINLSFGLQAEEYKWFLKNQKKFRKQFDVQDVKTTNDILFSRGMSLKQYRNINKDSLAKILNVDVVFFCSGIVENDPGENDKFPFIAPGPLLGGMLIFTEPINVMHKLTVTLGINEKNNATPFWSQKYGHYNNGINKLHDIFNRILKDALHHFPKNKK